MAKKVSISFKENENELDLYEYLMSQISPSYFLKALIKKEMSAESSKNAEKKPIQ